jgi:hypothetical protein
MTAVVGQVHHSSGEAGSTPVAIRQTSSDGYRAVRVRIGSREGGMAVDYPDDAPEAYAQVGSSSWRSRNQHRCTSCRIVAPVEEICPRDRDGRLQACRPWVGQGYRGRDGQKPEDTADGWREVEEDGRPQRRCSTANRVGANYSSWKASEEQSKCSEPLRCSMSRVNSQENRCAKLWDASKKLSVVQKYFTQAPLGYFDLADQARHQRAFSTKHHGPKRSIRTAISPWKMHIPAPSMQKVTVHSAVL